jgi:diguanylate cyclase (GGDEF)-like protein
MMTTAPQARPEIDSFIVEPSTAAPTTAEPAPTLKVPAVVDERTDEVPRRDTPLLPSRPIPSGASRATVTVISGSDPGRMIAVGRSGMVVGRGPNVDLVVDDMAVSRRHARIGPAPEGGFFVEDLSSVNGTFVGDRRISCSPLTSGDRLQLGPRYRLRFAVLDAADESLHQLLYETSVHDGLTHVFNRRYLEARLVAHVDQASRNHTDAALLMIDVDRFKQLNDRHGHMAGDRALATLASHLASMTRVEDLVGRFGGDEFVVLATGMTLGEGTRLAERVRRDIQDVRFGAGGGRVAVTVSIGVASLGEVAGEEVTDATEALLTRADERLLRAKARGRNRVCADLDRTGGP